MSSTKAIPLLGEQATTRNPPDVSSKTHIIALCGTSEIQSEASPRKDGWMVADFFLWKAILKGMGASQTWMTCLDPRKLIEKYESQYPDGLYLQGDPYEENRAVMLSRARLDSAMENLVMTCKRAAQDGESVLIIIASHGDMDVSQGGLVVGLPEPVRGQNHDAAQLLTSDLLGKTVKDVPNVKISTFLTSCYSENWVISPNWAPCSEVVMAAAKRKEESWSWIEATAGRFCGGVFSTYVLQELLLEAKVIKDPKELGGGDDSERSFKRWCDAVKAEMLKCQVRGKDFGSTPCFTEQGGHNRFWGRSGYPMGDYYSNWSVLPKVGKSLHANPYQNRRRMLDKISDQEMDDYWDFMRQSDFGRATEEEAAEAAEQMTARTGSWSGSLPGVRLRSRVKHLIKIHGASEPGFENSAENQYLHGTFWEFFDNKLNDSELVQLENTLTYRLHKMDGAERLLREMGNLYMVPIAKWRWEDWSSQNLSLEDEQKAQERNEKFEYCLQKIKKWPLCQVLEGISLLPGREWLKPERYLAAAFCEGDKDPEAEYRDYVQKKLPEARLIARRCISTSQSLRNWIEGLRTYRVNKERRSPRKQRAGIHGVFEGADNFGGDQVTSKGR